MAIYTNYGRYLKAKQFKKFLQEQGDIYMVFGLGNPRWDYHIENELSQGQMPIAPYNTSILIEGNAQANQFYDNHVNSLYWDEDGPKYFLKNGIIVSTSGVSLNDNIKEKTYLSECRDVIPPFPCIWENYENYGDSSLPDEKLHNNPLLLSYGGGKIRQNEYHNYYILRGSNSYEVYKNASGNVPLGPVSIPPDQEGSQYFAELYLRGLAINNNIKHPVGLLGAVKCSIHFVKDIGDNSSNTYTGSVKQFWYGDRYWEIVEPDETYVENYIGAKTNQETYPHHLIITATVNPRNLCAELNIDQCIVPRQIAVYTRPLVGSIHGKSYYRVGENVFNFGQYTAHDFTTEGGWQWFEDNKPIGPRISETVNGEILNFALPCKFRPNGKESEVEYPGNPDTDFRFILHDYIKGSVREDKHAVDRFGYVVGF